MSEATSETLAPKPKPEKLHKFEMVWTVEYRTPIQAPSAMEALATWRRMEKPEANPETRSEITDHEVESLAQCCPHCGEEIEEA